MRRAISETNRRRRHVQIAYNRGPWHDPQTIRKAVTDILSMLQPTRLHRCRQRPSASARSTTWPASCGSFRTRSCVASSRHSKTEMHEASADLWVESCLSQTNGATSAEAPAPDGDADSARASVRDSAELGSFELDAGIPAGGVFGVDRMMRLTISTSSTRHRWACHPGRRAPTQSGHGRVSMLV